MRGKFVLCMFIVILLTSSFFVNASSINISNKNNLGTLTNTAELPQWRIGNYWKYNMDFKFSSKDGSSTKFSIDARITNMVATVTSIEDMEGELIYILTVDGSVLGTVSLFEAEIEIADLRGDFGGAAHISKNTLGIKRFVFEVDGQVNVPILGWRDLFFTMVMDFIPCFNFFDFPINEGEEPWDVHISKASLVAYANIDIPFGESDFNSSMVFNDVMSVDRWDSVTVPAGVYDAFILSGTWGQLSNLWYAPSAGYLVKIDETLTWENGKIEAEFHLNLLETNYDVDNDPPNNPNKPQGETDGIMEEEYEYETRATDPNQDQIYYWFDWGDGFNSGWVGPYASGQTATASHMWYNKGMYNVIVKAKDVVGIESGWSEPLPVMIKGDPKANLYMYYIEELDDIDVFSEPEWYYTVSVGDVSQPESYYNTHDGTEKGDWVADDTWKPEKYHDFIVSTRETLVTIKLMDHDDRWEDPIYAADDLADVSGCNGDGVDNDIAFSRGAIYHGTYDLVTNKLKQWETGNPGENADFVYKEDGYYITAGDHKPDNSETYDGNDAEVWFRLENDYSYPQATAILMDEIVKIRPYMDLQFAGTVKEGAPPYSWKWDFDDGTIVENQQNPSYAFDEAGEYTVKLTVTDNFGQTSSSSVNIEVENENPILTYDRVDWTGQGSIQDTFTFLVYYVDPDLDTPPVKTVVIDGSSKTLTGTGGNAEYLLELKGNQIGSGDHTYYFYFEDGYGGSAQTSEKSFSVSRARLTPRLDIVSKFLDRYPMLKILLDLYFIK